MKTRLESKQILYIYLERELYSFLSPFNNFVEPHMLVSDIKLAIEKIGLDELVKRVSLSKQSQEIVKQVEEMLNFWNDLPEHDEVKFLCDL